MNVAKKKQKVLPYANLCSFFTISTHSQTKLGQVQHLAEGSMNT